MIKELTLLGELEGDLRVSFHNVDQVARLLKPFAEQDKPLEVTVSIHRKKRSDRQNRYMWGVIVPTVWGWLKDTQGEEYSKDEVYYYVNAKALGRSPVIKDIAGEEVIIMEGKRFSQMNTKEFTDAVDTIIQYFADRGLEIPVPTNENLITDYLNDD